MIIKIGTHRVAIILTRSVVKIPRLLDPIFFLRTCAKWANRWKFRGIWLTFLELKDVFMQGFWENWNEHLCWKENSGRIDYLVRTKFSLLGLIAVQEKCDGDNITGKEVIQICNKIYSTMQKEFWKTDHHTLTNENNYLLENGVIKIVDYGSLREFIKRRGKEFGEILKQIK